MFKSIATVFIATLFGFLVTYGGLSYSKPSPWHYEQAEVVTFNPGGNPFEFASAFTQMRVEGKKLRIEGPCMSACTTFLNIMEPENVCASSYAAFGFHGAERGGKYLRDITDYLINAYYPPHVIALLDEKWDRTTQVVDPKNLDVIWLSREQVQVQPCENVIR